MNLLENHNFFAPAPQGAAAASYETQEEEERKNFLFLFPVSLLTPIRNISQVDDSHYVS